jgi:hypothetical protein
VPFLLSFFDLNGAQIVNGDAGNPAFLKQLALSRVPDRFIGLDRSLDQLTAGERMTEGQNLRTSLGHSRDDRARFLCLRHPLQPIAADEYDAAFPGLRLRLQSRTDVTMAVESTAGVPQIAAELL